MLWFAKQGAQPIHTLENPDSAGSGAWQHRLIQMARGMRQEGCPRQQLRSDLWVLLHVKLRQHIRAQARRLGPLSEEDVEDLASRKALEVLSKIDSRKWRADAADPGEVVRFVASVARFGVIDHLRKQGRHPMETHETQETSAAEAQRSTAADEGLDRGEFAQALVHCAGKLKPVHRNVWLFRAFYEMSSKQIAAHPEIGLEVGNVDVILQRTRKQLSTCLASHGVGPEDLRPGAFTAAWRAFRLPSLRREVSDAE